VDFEICTVSLLPGKSLNQENVHPADLQNNSDILFLSSHYISNLQIPSCQLTNEVSISKSVNLENEHGFLQGEGSLLATGSYDGQARIWSKDGMVA
jgi:hypothetical protein